MCVCEGVVEVCGKCVEFRVAIACMTKGAAPKLTRQWKAIYRKQLVPVPVLSLSVCLSGLITARGLDD